MIGEQLYQLTQAGPDTPQCVVCNQTAEHKCAACGEQICAEHSRTCGFCEASDKPAVRYCEAHVLEIEEKLFICEGHMPDLQAEVAALLLQDAGLIEVEVMA